MTHQAHEYPPHDLQAERGVIGGIMLHDGEHKIMSTITGIVQDSDFYDRRNGQIFMAAHLLWDQGTPVDEITLASLLTEMGALDQVGGPDYLADCADLVLPPAHVEHYARIIRKKARLRQVLATAQEVARKTQGGSQGDPDELLAELQEQVNRAAVGAGTVRAQSCADLVPEVYAELEKRQSQGKDDSAVPYGFVALDRITGGMSPGQLIIAAGRPGMGKTSFKLRVARNVALAQGLPVLFISREQRSQELMAALICSECRIDTERWRTGKLSPNELSKVRDFRAQLEQVPLYWHYTRNPKDMLAVARAIKAKHGLYLICADYLQKLARSTKYEDVSAMSGACKDLALDLEVPVLAGSQLSRKVEERTDKRPVMSDLKNAGDIEQDADVGLLLFRPYVYDNTASQTLAEVGVGKQRWGRTGKVKLKFVDWCIRFDDHEDDENPAQGRMY